MITFALFTWVGFFVGALVLNLLLVSVVQAVGKSRGTPLTEQSLRTMQTIVFAIFLVVWCALNLPLFLAR